MSDKTALGAGKKRTLNFTSGTSPQEEIVAEGMLKSALTVSVAQVSQRDLTYGTQCTANKIQIFVKQIDGVKLVLIYHVLGMS